MKRYTLSLSRSCGIPNGRLLREQNTGCRYFLRNRLTSISRDLWHVLALLGGLGLLLEWLLVGRAEGRMRRLAGRPANLRGIGIRKAS